jgi:hypothetical protein
MKTVDQVEEIIKKRAKIVYDYCVLKGWPLNPNDLTIEQIMEIRSLDDWKNASK